MGNKTAHKRRHKSVQRKPNSQSGTTAAHAMQSPSPLSMQSRSGSRATPITQAKLTVNTPGDRYEQQADSIAAKVVQLPAAARVSVAQNPRELGLQRAEDEDTVQNMPQEEPVQRVMDDVNTHDDQNPRAIQRQNDPVAQPPSVTPNTASYIRNPGGGRPLDPTSRTRIESVLQADLGDVRVHDDERSHEAAESFSAQAFTHRHHIFLNQGASSNNIGLMAHEATHVVQQGAAVRRQTQEEPVQRMAEDDTVQMQAEEETVSTGGAPSVQRIIPLIAIGVAGYFAAKKTVEYLWEKFEQNAPKELVTFVRTIKERGIFGWLQDLLFGELAGVFESLKAIPEGIKTLFEAITELPGIIGDLVKNLASGDKKKVFGALANLIEAMRKILDVIWPAIKVVLTPIAWAFKTIMTWISDAAKWLSDLVGGIVNKIMGAASWFLRNFQKAWNWVLKYVFRIDSDLDIADWAIRQARKYFDKIIAQPFKNGLMAISKFSKLLGEALSVENIEKIVLKISNFLVDAEVFMENLASEDEESGVVQNRSILEIVAELIVGVISDISQGIFDIGTWLSNKVGGLADKVDSVFEEIRSWEPLATVMKGVAWVQEKVRSLGDWAKNAVLTVFFMLSQGVKLFGQLVRPVLKLIRGIFLIVVDIISNLPNVLGLFKELWNLVPAFIRDPIEKFVKEQVAERVPLLKEFLAFAQFAKVLAGLLSTLFFDILTQFKLWGPLKKFFKGLVEAIGFPIKLVQQIISKAMSVFNQIVNDPLGFFKNLFRAVKLGFSNFFDKIKEHLLSGVLGWLFGQVRKAGLTPPKSLQLAEIFGFIVQIMGITEDLIFERLGKHKAIGKQKAQKIRKVYKFLTGAWVWLVKFITEGAQAVWEDIKEKLTALKDKFITGVIDWLMTTVIEFAIKKVLSFLDPTGIMAVINSAIAIYRAIQSFIEQAKAMLEIVHTVLTGIAGLAAGKIEQAAKYVEQALVKALPVAISFLANQFGLRNVGKRIGEMVKKIRGYVIKAIDWLINKAVKAAKGILDRIFKKDDKAKPGEFTVDEPLERKIVTEGHTLRARFKSNQLSFLMASATFDSLVKGLDRVQDDYKTALLNAGKASEVATMEAEMQTLKEDAKRRQASLNSQKPSPKALPYEQDAYKKKALKEINAIQIKLDQLTYKYAGGGVLQGIKVDDIIVILKQNHGMKVIKVNVEEKLDDRIFKGIWATAWSGGSKSFYPYDTFGKTWNLPKDVLPIPAYSTPSYSTYHHDSSGLRSATVGPPLNPKRTRPSGDPPGLGGIYSNRGHLVANRFYGPNKVSSGNIVAMTRSANDPDMKKLENAVAAQVEKGRIFDYKVLPLDNSGSAIKDSSLPEKISVVADRIWPNKQGGEVEGEVRNS